MIVYRYRALYGKFNYLEWEICAAAEMSVMPNVNLHSGAHRFSVFYFISVGAFNSGRRAHFFEGTSLYCHGFRVTCLVHAEVCRSV